MEHALEKFVATGAGGRRGSFLPILADIQIRQSDFTSALKTLENAHAISTDSGERTTESEILYLTGLTLYKCGAEKRKIEQTLNKAREISQADGAKVFEERVTALTEMM
jgi:cation transport regulator ChaC